MMEIIHDVAPGATLAFHTAFDGQADFAQGILDLKKAGAKVIVNDVGYIDEPMFQDGIIAQAVDRVVARRAAYFSAAGNDARQSYQSRFRPSGRFVQEGPNLFCEAHDFDPGSKVDVRQRIRLPAGGLLNLSFQWDQPFFSVSGAPGAASDLDILVFDAARNFVSGGTRTIASGDPVEFFEFQNLGAAAAFNIMITNCSVGANTQPAIPLLLSVTPPGSAERTSAGFRMARGGRGKGSVGGAFHAGRRRP